MGVNALRAPFPWFGGKSRVAHVVWERFGDVPNYVEPFAGSLAVLLARPHPPRIETVNDLDCYLANFWRAVVADPDAVAFHADWPVNEADLHARHRWLVNDGRAVVDRLRIDPDYHDARIAGWWVWGLCAWIGSGWCASPRQQQRNDGVRPDLSAEGRGVHAPTAQVRDLSGRGMGVHSKRPHLQTEGKGMHRKLPAVARGSARGGHREQIPSPQIPHLGNAGRGVAASSVGRRPALGQDGWGVNAGGAEPIAEWMHALADRLRRVRVCCGDWTRVVTPAVTFNHGVTGVLLDPPYSQDEREAVIYGVETNVADAVRGWAVANGDNPLLRIALCGYEGEHEMPASWTKVAWKAHGGYGSGRGGRADDNAHRERIWFSPHCLDPRVMQRSLWEAAS